MLGLVGGAVYTLLLLMAAVGDFRTRRIPNRLTGIMAVLGLLWSVGLNPVVPGALQGAGGLLTGLVCWLPFYALGWLGAGDVKLFAAAGAWLGPLRTVEGALVAAVVGALLALVWMVFSYGGKDAAATLAIAASRPSVLTPASGKSGFKKTIPYGVALALGALAVAWMPGVLFKLLEAQ